VYVFVMFHCFSVESNIFLPSNNTNNAVNEVFACYICVGSVA